MTQTCATCAAVQAYEPKPDDPPETADYGWCHANPPVMLGDKNTSHFPPVSLSRTWCRGWRPKTTQ